MILPILRMGHPVLRQRAREMTKEEILSPATRELVENMIETMHEADGVGLAAPQVGHSLRLAVIEFEDDNPRYTETGAQGLTVFINPVIKVLGDTRQGFWEGCLSVPGLRGYVERPSRVVVDYLDLNGDPQRLEGEEFLATVLQHEFDHLDGVLYLDRITDETKIAYNEEFVEHILKDDEEDVEV